MSKKTNRERILAALIETSTIVEAAKVAGLGEATVYRYLQDADLSKNTAMHDDKRLSLLLHECRTAHRKPLTAFGNCSIAKTRRLRPDSLKLFLKTPSNYSKRQTS